MAWPGLGGSKLVRIWREIADRIDCLSYPSLSVDQGAIVYCSLEAREALTPPQVGMCNFKRLYLMLEPRY